MTTSNNNREAEFDKIDGDSGYIDAMPQTWFNAGWDAALSSRPTQPTTDERDAREYQHVECDCVPNLGPSHCHLCSGDGSPVEWPCAAARVADERGNLIAGVQAVRSIHSPEEVSVMARTAPADYELWPMVEVEICSSCGAGIDLDEDSDENDVQPYLWPCSTIAALESEVQGQ